MSNKKKSRSKTAKNTPGKQKQQANQPPKWGMLVAGLFAFLMVGVALVVMNKIGVENQWIRIGIVLVLAVAAGLGAGPLTMSLQKRFTDNS